MKNINKNSNQFPNPGDGIIHGPFRTPDVSRPEERLGNQWIMDMAEQDPSLYQLMMQREAIYEDIGNRENSEIINPNLNRITKDIDVQKLLIRDARGLANIAEIREVRPPTNKKR